MSDEFNGRNKDPKTMQPRDHLTIGLANLWEAITDNSVSRVYLGVHWQFDGVTKRNAANTDDEFGVPADVFGDPFPGVAHRCDSECCCHRWRTRGSGDETTFDTCTR